jgi:hypothetical protein
MKHPRISCLSLGVLTLVYLALPLLIFFAGWLKPVYAILSTVPILFCGWHLIRQWPVESATFRRGEITFVALFSLALTAFVGIGGFAPQESDWIKHNAVLFDCVNLPWPVVMADGPARWPLVYYLAYYLPAALVGKIAGYAAAQVALWLWSSWGVMLACLWFARLSRLPAWVAAPAFFAFSGLDFLASLLVQILGLSIKHGALDFYPNQSWSRIWQFPCPFWALTWAPGQALAGWLSSAMVLATPKTLRPACVALLFTLVLLWSPLVGVGLGLLAFFLVRREALATVVKSLVPMLPLILPLFVLIAFFAAKVSPDVASQFPRIPITWFTHFSDAPTPLKSVLLLVLFIIFEFGIYLWLVRARFPKGTDERQLANAAGLALVCLLSVTVGGFSDLSMRASAAPLFCVALLTARTIMAQGLAPRMRQWLWIVILIGSLTPIVEVSRQAYHIAIRRYDPRVVPHQVSAVVNMADGMFPTLGAQYVGSTNSFFERNLAK